jgi:hypothetical protein
MDHRYANVFLPDLGPATGLAILGFRAHAFGCARCCSIESGFRSALGDEAETAISDLRTFTHALGHVGARRISLSAPGCGRMTRDEVSIACAFAATQAWDCSALNVHLSWLLAGPVPEKMTDSVVRIGDIFAGHGLAFNAPKGAPAVPNSVTPAFRADRLG